ncbi:L,D-transpeptidase [Methyloligella sp. 2.7D]|uniref:L,D-transpeptidase n=1 Tax=unclassified Methyloligella TaxID=2625955 RepID=UPI00157C013C|nr:L,D-transpeptidase [Methyloligella sp. GL2]QKP76105.1 L,D-transpeptidase [Methyloligella sp. GL2]
MGKIFLYGVGISILAFIVAFLLFTTIAHAGVVAQVSLANQRMNVIVDGRQVHSWPVSTGVGRYHTPTGTFKPYFLSRHHRSSKYAGAPMPYSIFFYKGYAIHGSYEIKSLGRPASHGCVRLHPKNAAKLYSLVQTHGSGDTVIRISQ